MLHRMLDLGVTELTVRASHPVAEAAGSTSPAPRWLVRVTLGYRLVALGDGPREAVVDWVLARSSSGWVVADEKGVGGGPPWAVDGSVVRSAPGQVVVSGLDAAATDAVVADLSAARHTVGAAFGRLPRSSWSPGQPSRARCADRDRVRRVRRCQGPHGGARRLGGGAGRGHRLPCATARVGLTPAGRRAVISTGRPRRAPGRRATGRLPVWLGGLAKSSRMPIALESLPRSPIRWCAGWAAIRCLLHCRALRRSTLAQADVQAAYLMSWRAARVPVSRRDLAAVVALRRLRG